MYAHGAILGHHIQNWGNIYIYIQGGVRKFLGHFKHWHQDASHEDTGRKSASPLLKLCHMLSLQLREYTGNYGTTVSGSIWSRSIFLLLQFQCFRGRKKLFVKWVNLWCLFFVVCSILRCTLSLIFQAVRHLKPYTLVTGAGRWGGESNLVKSQIRSFLWHISEISLYYLARAREG